MIKVLFITVRSDMGGGPKHVFDLCSNLKDVEAYIAAPNEEPFYEKFQSISKAIIEIPHRKFSILKFFKLLTYCRENGINTVHSHGRGAGIYSRLLGLFGMKVIHTFHGVHIERTLIGKIKLFIDVFLKNIDQKNICVSDSEYEIARSAKITNHSEVINNGVTVESINNQFSKVRRGDGLIILGTLARLTHQKGLDLLVERMVDLPSNYKLLIAGGGELKDSLERRIKELNIAEKVILVGNVSEPIKFLGEIDIYISNARWEGLPLSVLEAMACNLPVLISRVPGHVDLEKFLEKYSIFSENEDILEKLEHLFNTKSSNKKIIEKNFTIEKMSNETRLLYF